MNKRWLITGAAAALLLVTSSGAVSAAAEAKPIHVKLNGQEVVFPVSPAVISGKTYVEFRTLFTALGYKVDYAAATKKMKAQSQVRTIEMSTSGTTALVDGKSVSTQGEIKFVNGRTLVGIRFIATLSAKNVEWNAAKQTVFITDTSPNAQEKAALFSVLDRISAAEAAGDAKAFLALVHPDSPMLEVLKVSIPAQFAGMKTQTTYVEKKIQSFTANEAVLITKEENRKVSGDGFYPDHTAEMSYTLRKDSTGQWSIYIVDQLSFEALDPAGLWKQEIQAPEADKKEIAALLNAQALAINNNDLAAYSATIDPSSPGAKEAAAGLKDLLASVKLKMVIEKSAIVQMDEHTATLLTSITVQQTDGKDIPTTRSLSLMNLIKVDGKWLFEAGILDLHTDLL